MFKFNEHSLRTGISLQFS